jgi:hypothetical protein
MYQDRDIAHVEGLLESARVVDSKRTRSGNKILMPKRIRDSKMQNKKVNVPESIIYGVYPACFISNPLSSVVLVRGLSSYYLTSKIPSRILVNPVCGSFFEKEMKTCTQILL